MTKNVISIPFIKIYKTSKSILNSTPETWLEFSAGQNTSTNLSRFKKNNFFAFFEQILGFFYFLVKSISIRTTSIPKSNIIFFASTQNQFSVLSPIQKELQDIQSNFFIPNNTNLSYNSKREDLIKMKLSFLYLLPIFCLLINRLPSLIILLWRTDKRLISLRLKSFLSIYYWLVAHQLIISTAIPKIIVVSNDHNPENRTLIELCKSLKIKTAYIPHASVSERFHSLDFDYSFLDGEHAFNTYKKCDLRRAPNSKPVEKRFCFLLGNLRKLDLNFVETNQRDKFGLALKGTDDLHKIAQILSKLGEFKPIVIRPHPNLKFSKNFDDLEKKFHGLVELSDPENESVSNFLSSINILVSGNSTLSLEAASIGIHPVYLRELSGGAYDYYGFVKRKIVDSYNDIDDFINNYVKKSNKSFIPDSNGINYYWSSHGKPYFNQEAKIISEYLKQIINDSPQLNSDFSIVLKIL